MQTHDLSAHKNLVKRATHWLKNTMRCGVVLEEAHGYDLEIPDAIGWNVRMSILIECKTSRSDFLRDVKNKRRRHHPRYAIGEQRYYMTLPRLLKPNEIPDGWGLLEVHRTQVRIKKQASKRFTSDYLLRSERSLLRYALQYVQENSDDNTVASRA